MKLGQSVRWKGSAEYVSNDNESRHEEYGDGEGFLKGRAGQIASD